MPENKTIFYYSFGSSIAKMSFSKDTGNKYRYSFNGKESDKETGLQDYGFRIYNPSIGKFLSVDPLAPKYPFLTPYQFASDNPILFIDIDGLEGGVLPLPRILPRLGPIYIPLPPAPPALPPFPISINWEEFLNPTPPIPPVFPIPGACVAKKPLSPSIPKPIVESHQYNPKEFDDLNWGGGYKNKIPQNKRNSKPKDDVPDWTDGYRPRNGESEKEFAKRLCDEKYGQGNWKNGPKTEFNKIQKWGDVHFENSCKESVILQYNEDYNNYNLKLKDYYDEVKSYNEIIKFKNEYPEEYNDYIDE